MTQFVNFIHKNSLQVMKKYSWHDSIHKFYPQNLLQVMPRVILQFKTESR